MGEKAFISEVESGQNDIPYEIFNLEDKDDQGIIEEIKDTNHSFSPEDSKQNDALLTEFFKNNTHTRLHAVEPPMEWKKIMLKVVSSKTMILILKKEPMKILATKKRILPQNLKLQSVPTPLNDFHVLIIFV